MSGSGGIWPEGGLLYRIAKRCERWFFSRADAIVTLTDASISQVRQGVGHSQVGIEVIPACVELDRFLDRPAREGGPHAVWSGSIGTWYRFELAAPFAWVLSMPLTVLTPPDRTRPGCPRRVPGGRSNGGARRDVGPAVGARRRQVPDQVVVVEDRVGADQVRRAPRGRDAGHGDSGRRRLGIEDRVGVVLGSDGDRSIRQVAEQIKPLANDPDTRDRCWRGARAQLDVNARAARYAALYRHLT